MALFGRPVRNSQKRRRTFMAWAAAFALLMETLIPLSVAWASDVVDDDELLVICTANGIQAITIDQNGEPIESTNTGSCPFCLVHMAPVVFNSQAPTVAALVSPTTGNYFTQTSFYTPSNIWCGTTRPSRAPPPSV